MMHTLCVDIFVCHDAYTVYGYICVCILCVSMLIIAAQTCNWHTERHSGSDLDGDQFFVCWDSRLHAPSPLTQTRTHTFFWLAAKYCTHNLSRIVEPVKNFNPVGPFNPSPEFQKQTDTQLQPSKTETMLNGMVETFARRNLSQVLHWLQQKIKCTELKIVNEERLVSSIYHIHVLSIHKPQQSSQYSCWSGIKMSTIYSISDEDQSCWWSL